MKNFIFSAVAMVAFVGSSMANTSEIKVDELLSKGHVTYSGCTSVYLDTYQAAVDNGANDDQALKVAWRAYKSCLNVLTPANP